MWPRIFRLVGNTAFRFFFFKLRLLGPGGLDDMGRHFNCTGGVTGYIDRQVFGDHMLKHPDCQKVYENTVYFDPEGCNVAVVFCV